MMWCTRRPLIYGKHLRQTPRRMSYGKTSHRLRVMSGFVGLPPRSSRTREAAVSWWGFQN